MRTQHRAALARSGFIVALASGMLLAGVSASAADQSADWSSYNRTLAGDRYAPQKSVTPASANGRRGKRCC